MEFDFEQNASVDTLDNVPAEYHGLYTKGQDNKFGIADFAKPIVDAYSGVAKALKSEQGHKKILNDENARRRLALKAFEDLSKELGLEGDDLTAAFKSHIADLTDKVKNGAEVKINLDKIKGDFQKQMDEMAQAKDGEITKMRASLERYLVDQAATAALAAEKGSVDLLLPHIQKSVKVVAEGEDFVVRVVDGAGDARSNGKGGWMSVADLVKEMKTQATFARAFESEAAGGTGHRPGSSGRPAPAQKAEMTSVDKISAGLANRRR